MVKDERKIIEARQLIKENITLLHECIRVAALMYCIYHLAWKYYGKNFIYTDQKVS